MDKAEAKKSLRKTLIEERLNLPDRLERAEALQRVMRIWLVGRPDAVIVVRPKGRRHRCILADQRGV